jgi:transcriptional regulator with XRE-family HTH domain
VKLRRTQAIHRTERPGPLIPLVRATLTPCRPAGPSPTHEPASAAAIRAARVKAGRTQADVAEQAGMSVHVLRQTEQGRRRINLGEAAAIARHSEGRSTSWSLFPPTPRLTRRGWGGLILLTEPELRCFRRVATACCARTPPSSTEAELWPTSTQLEFSITTLVIGLPRQVVVQRCRRSHVGLVVRDDGAVWPSQDANRRAITEVPSGRQ